MLPCAKTPFPLIQCNQEETLVHLFGLVLLPTIVGTSSVHKELGISVLDSFYDIRDKLKLSFSMEIAILATKSIWIVTTTKISRTKGLLFIVGKQYMLKS
jgi:hypothetical protein